ncbi:MAG: chorismate synthase [Methylotenera sp.]
MLKVLPQLEEYLDKIRAERDSVGARLTVVAEGVPSGLGRACVRSGWMPILRYAMMSINAVKGVEIGAGFAAMSSARQRQHS